MYPRFNKWNESDSDDDFLSTGPPKKDESTRETYLFDFSMKLSLNTPDCGLHQSNMVNAAVTTAISHALFKHQEWTPLSQGLYHVIQAKMRPSTIKRVVMKGRRICEACVKVSGRFVDLEAQLGGPKSIHEKVSYNGCLDKSTIVLEYEATLFLSSVHCDADTPDSTVFSDHGFPLIHVPKPKDNGIDNFFGIFEAHQEKNLIGFDHELSWATTSGYLKKKTEERLEEMMREFGGLD